MDMLWFIFMHVESVENIYNFIFFTKHYGSMTTFVNMWLGNHDQTGGERPSLLRVKRKTDDIIYFNVFFHDHFDIGIPD